MNQVKSINYQMMFEAKSAKETKCLLAVVWKGWRMNGGEKKMLRMFESFLSYTYLIFSWDDLCLMGREVWGGDADRG